MKTEIACIIDRSGSMSTIRDDAIGGFNTFLEAQKAVPGEANLTLVLFDHEYLEAVAARPLAEVDPLTVASYVPRGTTALLDAVGRTIDSVGARLAATPEHERPDKVIVAILTDGLENASREYSLDRIKEMITHQRDIYSWEFIFLAANQDAFVVGSSMGISALNTAGFVPSPEGTAEAYDRMSTLTTNYRTGKKVSN